MSQSQLLFSSKELSNQFEQMRFEIQQAIKGETDDYIRNVNKEAYIASLESRFLIEELQIEKEKVYIVWGIKIFARGLSQYLKIEEID